jgi:hypothetical protein
MYNSDILINGVGNYIYKTNSNGTVDLQFKTDKNTNILALMNRFNQLKYMADLAVLDLDIAINNMYLEAQQLGLDITELNIDIKNGVLILNEKIEGVKNA